MADVHTNYLRDLGFLLRERAEAARCRAREAKGTPEESFESGRALAYYEVVSLMANQAETFGLPPVDLAFEDFDPGRLLE